MNDLYHFECYLTVFLASDQDKRKKREKQLKNTFSFCNFKIIPFQKNAFKCIGGFFACKYMSLLHNKHVNWVIKHFKCTVFPFGYHKYHSVTSASVSSCFIVKTQEESFPQKYLTPWKWLVVGHQSIPWESLGRAFLAVNLGQPTGVNGYYINGESDSVCVSHSLMHGLL